MKHVLMKTYEVIVEIETMMMVHLNINPFDLGNLPLLDFNMYYNKIINMLDDMKEPTMDNIGIPI